MSDDHIEHVVLLALENHSFDQMLGSLKQHYPELEGITPATPNRNVDSDGTVYPQQPTEERQVPLDPHHEVEWAAEQLADQNGGFVRNFSKMYPQSRHEDRQYVMGYYRHGFLPALHSLADEFTICDHWFSSLPGPTWPNRFMMLTGTAMGRVNMPGDGTHKSDLPGYFQQIQVTIFDRLTEKGLHWKCYFHDIPQSWTLKSQRQPHNAARYFYISEFFRDALGREEDFPKFAFIEPDYMGVAGNDDHPPHDVMKAEKLIADVYNALRANSDLWKSTLLVVVYDEHGGFYDHVVPPSAVPPDDHREDKYTFDQLGFRVPALLVSPWVDRRVETTQFDHTSLLKYLIEKWDLSPLQSRRIDEARSIAVALRQQPRDGLLPRIDLTAEQLTPPDLELEEHAIADNSTHDQALSKLRDFVIEEAEIAVPTFYTRLSRWFEALKSVVWRSAPAAVDRRSLRASMVSPDKLGSASAPIKDDIARSLMAKKRQALTILAAHVRNTGLPDVQRGHAAQTLELISGRRFHRDQKVGDADRFLKFHGQ